MERAAILDASATFWKALERSDTATMRSVCDPSCYFVHIGGSCGLDEEMRAFDDGVFKPTEIVLNGQEVRSFGDTDVVVTDCTYGLLLDGEPTTHHFAVTEVYRDAKLIQFTFTALVY